MTQGIEFTFENKINSSQRNETITGFLSTIRH